ncbi:alanine racemase family protein (ISS) [Drepanopeziza brunnea f. sp. 'multigermtubi' MB_m1]|uniref:Pyridoxal phosphate homeostasis protein n=1 Tax=Marssonina brunnea f. sp. multigermtubi (strain MB_m1) TaxID=1072389 RepID=K1WP99_MARBU|nr:alanine racemase family protein (ISS) [Drepanopeziza brunnea f. sp. 'multigermtubi' MB_m1]EKD14791.1 alanine racemase family protein (ISS) [Drepanopeziza brunnea f. sp. 'multigermtubi' MB_m1]
MTTQQTIDMKFDAARAKDLVQALRTVQSRVARAAAGRDVPVSKLKPASDILALYQDAGQRHFGENYAQELIEKAEVLPRDVKWHFIGGLQSTLSVGFGVKALEMSPLDLLILWRYELPVEDIGRRNLNHCRGCTLGPGDKCRLLASSVPNLHIVSSVDSLKKATQLEAGRASLSPAASEPLNIHIQVNTSGEASKSGCAPGPDTSALAKQILTTCPNLRLLGLMTIGAIARSKAVKEGEENADFVTLREERDRLQRELEEGAWNGTLELSMGMSDDFEGAIEGGSDEVRVGSTIFGARPPKEEFKVKTAVEKGKS